MRWTISGLVWVCFAAPAWALDPLRTIPQYMRERWGIERGFPGGSILAIAQTPDGYLWIGTDKGLIRFNGLNFQSFPQAIPESFPIGPVQELLTDSEGNLWILTQNAKILRYRHGKFELSRGETEVGVTAIGRRSNGEALFSSLALGILSFKDGRLEPILSLAGERSNSGNAPSPGTAPPCLECSHFFAETNSAVISIAESSDGKLWLGTRDKGLFYVSNGRLSAFGAGLRDAKITCLLPLKHGELWIGTRNGLIAWDGAKLALQLVPPSLRHAEILTMIRDRDSNVWVGTADGLFRVGANGLSFDEENPGKKGPVTALFEDREGNLWAGSRQGIERLRDGAFVSYSLTGLQSESSGPMYVDQEKRTWFAPFEGGLHWLKDGTTGTVTADHLSQDVVYSIAGGQNDLWIGRQRGGLTHLHYAGASVTTATYTRSDGLAQNGVYAVYRDHDGAVWAATLSGGVSEYKDGRFTTYSAANGMASNTVLSIEETPDGTMWFATPNGLNAFSNGQWRVFTARDGMPSDSVNCLLSDSAGVLWIGTDSGLALLRSGRVAVPEPEPASLRGEILGVAEDGNGRLWIATASHVVAVKRDKVFGGVLSDADVRMYGLEDGLLGTEGVKRYRSVFADPFGRVWFSMNRGLSVVDTTRAVDDLVPAIIQIDELSVDGSAADLSGRIRIPAGSHKVTFTYSGLSLSVPERVRFRYKLDEFDQGWSAPVSTHEAVYTNLGSGSYRFRVIASNSDGLWNSAESSIAFRIDPVFWRTWWFQVSAAIAIAVIILAYTRFRMLALTRQLNVRFEERLAERTRIAQELHDTLLQGIISASMQLHVLADQVTGAQTKRSLDRVLELMTRVIEEGRNAVGGLRSPGTGPLDLEQALSQIHQEFPGHGDVGFRVIVEGLPQPLHPVIADEIYSIGREALTNAFRHSRAKKIEVELEYAAEQLRLLVRDDGVGLEPKVLRSGLPGHWGMSGMRERSKRIGARLRVLSRPAAGTEVELSVPGHIAFVPSPPRGLSKLVAKLWPRWRSGLGQSPSEDNQ